MNVPDYNCLVVLGPTASGKTRLACQLAYVMDGEIISADSRQVYKGLDIGTGKDYDDYIIKGKKIPFHLIDVAEPGEQFFLHDYIKALNRTFTEILSRGKLPIICGGTGLYLDTLRKNFDLTRIKEDASLRNELQPLDKQELIARLKQYPPEYTAHVDVSSAKRIIRGIEVAEHLVNTPPVQTGKDELPYRPYYIGIQVDAETRRKLVRVRLDRRLETGLIEEVERLIKEGLPHERLEQLGLEYRFISRYLKGKLPFYEMREKLITAIVQFSKRQMTWFRKMEKERVKIRWVNRDADPFVLGKEIRGILD